MAQVNPAKRDSLANLINQRAHSMQVYQDSLRHSQDSTRLGEVQNQVSIKREPVKTGVEQNSRAREGKQNLPRLLAGIMAFVVLVVLYLVFRNPPWLRLRRVDRKKV